MGQVSEVGENKDPRTVKCRRVWGIDRMKMGWEVRRELCWILLDFRPREGNIYGVNSP